MSHSSLPMIRPQGVSYRVTPENDSGPSGTSWVLIVGCPALERLAPGLWKQKRQDLPMAA